MGIWPHRLLARVSRHQVRALLLGAAFVAAFDLAAQEVSVEGRQPIVTRAQLQQAMEEAESIANSSAYSAAFRDGKRAEAALIRERLLEGDFYIGDQLVIAMTGGDSGVSGQQAIQPGRVLTMGGLPDIPMRGVLRSEAEGYLTEQVRRYVRDAQVKVRPLIRLTFRGGINKPGFYQMDADIMLSDALSQAGGIGNGTEFGKSKVLRGADEIEIVDGETIAKAIVDGVSLDRLNLRAGDVIEVGEVSKTNWLTSLRTIAAVSGLILSFYGLGRLFGIF